MPVLDEILEANESYASAFAKRGLPAPPARRLAIVTCMDARLDPAKFAGLAEGDAHVIRNAGGAITRCERPNALDLTWEYMGGTSWVTIRLAPDGPRARLTLEHIAHKDGIGEEHLKAFGPGAVGIGWDLALYGLERHLADPAAALDHEAVDAWTASSEGKAFMRASGEAWGAAHAASGEDPEEARAKAERTIAAYTGA